MNVKWENSCSYDIGLSVTASEYGNNLFRSYALNVIDPNRPSLSVTMENLDSEYVIGEPITLKGEVGCHNGECGEINIYAEYKKDEGNPWSHLTSSTPLSTSTNPNIITLV